MLSASLHATPVWAAQDAISPERQAILAARDRKASEARERGYWIVAPGEHLRLIAEQFFHGDRPRQARLREYLLEHNPHAFVHGDPDRLIAGSRLDMPPEVDAPVAAAKAQTAPREAARTTPPRATPAQAGTVTAPVTTVPAPEFAPGPPPKAKPPPPPAYVDQLIEGVSPEAGQEQSPGEAALQPGQRYVSAEYRAEGRAPPGGGHGLEQGVEVRLRRETLDYGDFDLEGAARDTRLAPGERSVSRRDG
ncbi:MAG TPA: hypothetical protein VLS49_04590, partial [Usitatibacter sp.]|nr:hypothetical protein [Usitatibacter sp.]